MNILEAEEQEEKLSDEEETEREFTYLVDRVSAGGGSEAAITARMRSGCAMLGLVVFSLRLKVAVYKSYTRPTILYESDEWCLKGSEMKIF